jgi:nicotinamidase-related amidase
VSEDLEAGRTALLIYDMTQTLAEEGRHLEPWVVDGMPGLARLLGRCREAGVLVTYAVSAQGYAGTEVCRAIAPLASETVIKHPRSGAFMGTDYEQVLRDAGRDTLLIAGMAVDRGCNTTAREALNRGLRAVIVRDACYTRDIAASPVGPVPKAEVARVHLAALHRIGAGIMAVDEIVGALGGG